MRKYEIMFIMRPTLSEEELKATVEKYTKLLEEKNAKILTAKKIGQQTLAYEIKKFTTGFYHLFLIEANDDAAVKEFDRVSLISNDIIRHLITKIEE